jgi:CYTH domain-containing protein
VSGVLDPRREPGRGRYARSERERRFLVRGTPPTGTSERLIEDRYLEGTTLRLRRVTWDEGAVFKLTQKVRPDAADPSHVLITNVYLTEDEHARLSALPALVVVKTRTAVPTPSQVFAVDVFHGRLEGLRLAEVELDDLSEPLHLPSWLGREVTHDDRFSGGALAATPAHDVARLLSTSSG